MAGGSQSGAFLARKASAQSTLVFHPDLPKSVIILEHTLEHIRDPIPGPSKYPQIGVKDPKLRVFRV